MRRSLQGSLLHDLFNFGIRQALRLEKRDALGYWVVACLEKVVQLLLFGF